MKNKNRKVIILYVLAMLKNATSDVRPTTQKQMQEALEILGFSTNRKTVASYINALIEFGYDIVKLPGGGVYMNSVNRGEK